MFEIRPRDLDLKTIVDTDEGQYMVSTVALAIEHIGGWYETMVFMASNGKVDDWGDHYCDRYETKEEAQEGHRQVAEGLKYGEIKLY